MDMKQSVEMLDKQVQVAIDSLNNIAMSEDNKKKIRNIIVNGYKQCLTRAMTSDAVPIVDKNLDTDSAWLMDVCFEFIMNEPLKDNIRNFIDSTTELAKNWCAATRNPNKYVSQQAILMNRYLKGAITAQESFELIRQANRSLRRIMLTRPTGAEDMARHYLSSLDATLSEKQKNNDDRKCDPTPKCQAANKS